LVVELGGDGRKDILIKNMFGSQGEERRDILIILPFYP